MNKINLSLASDGEDTKHTQVHLNATFENREMAIAFHAKIAALCEQANRSRPHNAAQWGQRLLGRA
jgi:hypothetical protein